MRWGKESNEPIAQLVNAPKLYSRGDVEQPEIRCPLCGKRFHTGDAMPCAACALAARCGLVMCPNCSYEFTV